MENLLKCAAAAAADDDYATTMKIAPTPTGLSGRKNNSAVVCLHILLRLVAH